MLVFECEGLRVVHAGDLGHRLSKEDAASLGRLDALMIPVGGFYTIGPADADGVIGDLKPRVVIPMHYKTAANKDWPSGTLGEFLRGKTRVKQRGKTATRTNGALPAAPASWVIRP